MQYLPLADEVVQTTQDLVDRGQLVGVVDPQEVDVVGVEPGEARLDRQSKVLAPVTGAGEPPVRGGPTRPTTPPTSTPPPASRERRTTPWPRPGSTHPTTLRPTGRGRRRADKGDRDARELSFSGAARASTTTPP